MMDRYNTFVLDHYDTGQHYRCACGEVFPSYPELIDHVDYWWEQP
jgi:hypothetical protein